MLVLSNIFYLTRLNMLSNLKKSSVFPTRVISKVMHKVFIIFFIYMFIWLAISLYKLQCSPPLSFTIMKLQPLGSVSVLSNTPSLLFSRLVRVTAAEKSARVIEKRNTRICFFNFLE